MFPLRGDRLTSRNLVIYMVLQWKLGDPPKSFRASPTATADTTDRHQTPFTVIKGLRDLVLDKLSKITK